MNLLYIYQGLKESILHKSLPAIAEVRSGVSMSTETLQQTALTCAEGGVAIGAESVQVKREPLEEEETEPQKWYVCFLSTCTCIGASGGCKLNS